LREVPKVPEMMVWRLGNLERRTGKINTSYIRKYTEKLYQIKD
jgi:hypothetical protein